MEVKGWSRALPFLMLLALLLPLFLPASIPGTYAQTPMVDVWTNKGGRGYYRENANVDGGEYIVGESITLYCELLYGAPRYLKIWLIIPNGSVVWDFFVRDNPPVGTYSVSGTVSEPTGAWIVLCDALSSDKTLLARDVVYVYVRTTATVTVYTTTTRTVTSTLHATATTETTTYTTTTRTLYTTFTRTWYTTVTTTVTTTITSWTTTTSWVTVFSGQSVSYERSGEGLVVLSLAALTPLASAYILRTRRRSRNS